MGVQLMARDDDGADDTQEQTTDPVGRPTPARDPFVGFVNGRPTYDYGPGYEGLGGAKR
jgi:hypothetical protein